MPQARTGHLTVARFRLGRLGSGRPNRIALRRALSWVVLSLCGATDCLGYTASLNPAAPTTVYLQVGVGSFTNTYIAGGQPQNNSTVNTVSTSVPAASVGNKTAQTMTTDSTASMSYWDGYSFCNVPGQLYIGGFFRSTSATSTVARVSASVPSVLTDAAGDTIPFSKIRWTSSGNGDSGTEPFPAAAFVSGSVQTVGSMSGNTWNESCWTFSYVNDTVPAAGTYKGTVLYTLSTP